MENISYERRVYGSVDNSKEPTLGYIITAFRGKGLNRGDNWTE